MHVLKLELKRSIFNKNMLIALAIGLALTLPCAISNYFAEQDYYAYLIANNLTTGADTSSLFGRWFGMTGSGEFTNVAYYYILPLLATFPAGTIYFKDRKSGYVKNLYTRYSKIKCLVAKYISTFASGAVVVMAPLVVSLMISSLYAPARLPDPTVLNQIHDTNMWSELFYSHPLVYTVAYIIMDGIFGGLFACFAMSVSEFVEHKFSVFISSFLVVMAASFFFSQFNVTQMNPQNFLSPAQIDGGASGVVILVEGMILFVVSLCLFFVGGIRNETY